MQNAIVTLTLAVSRRNNPAVIKTETYVALTPRIKSARVRTRTSHAAIGLLGSIHVNTPKLLRRCI